MNVNGKNYRTIWVKEEDDTIISIIDQRYLPHQFVIKDLHSAGNVVLAIKDMQVRGAGLIGATAAYGMYLASIEAATTNFFDKHLNTSAVALKDARPTAVNLEWAVDIQLQAIAKGASPEEKNKNCKKILQLLSLTMTQLIVRRLVGAGVDIIEQLSEKKKGEVVNILTHCNAGWLAFVDHGSATAPIYEAFEKGIKIHVWVDETRPRNQGAGSLTAWELINHGVPHTVITDNAGGHLMQHGLVDMIITGADRVTKNGDAANKIGTYLKALAALDNKIPFYVALPFIYFRLEDQRWN